MAPPPRSRLVDQEHISLAIPPFPIRIIMAILLLSSKIPKSRGAFYTPCNYPVPSTPTFETQCSNNYLKSTYTCDVDGQISIAEVEKIDSILSHYDIFSKKQVGVGLAVLRILEYPNWTNVNLPDAEESRQEYSSSESNTDTPDTDSGPLNDPSMDGQNADPDTDSDADYGETRSTKIRRDQTPDPNIGSALSNPDWYCLKKSQADYYRKLDPGSPPNNNSLMHYLRTFADALRRRWFGQEGGLDLFFLVITESVIDRETRRILLQSPVIQVSMGQELEQILPPGYALLLQAEVSFLVSRDWSPQPIFLALERVGEKVTPEMIVERRVNKIIVDGNSQAHNVTPVFVYHTIPAWAIYTFIGCIGSVGVALALEWTIVRRKALTLRPGGGGGGGERQRSSKSDNVQVHLYF